MKSLISEIGKEIKQNGKIDKLIRCTNCGEITDDSDKDGFCWVCRPYTKPQQNGVKVRHYGNSLYILQDNNI